MKHRARLRIGTRGSPLAPIQTEEVRRKLHPAWSDLAVADIVATPIRTSGVHDRALPDAPAPGDEFRRKSGSELFAAA